LKPFPHEYWVRADAEVTGNVALTSEGLPPLETAPPAEFDGPGDQWSPESLLVAAAADCFVLTFRAIARASRLEWTGLTCRAHGTLDRVDGVTRFVAMRIVAELVLPRSADAATAQRLLEKSERGCLITQSLKLTPELETHITQE
jgi:organic hydroperoxide reductase OsmC/OhrA